METMETKRIKHCLIIVVICVLVIVGVFFFQNRGKDLKEEALLQEMQEISLEAKEDTPGGILSKIQEDHKETEETAEAQKDPIEETEEPSVSEEETTSEETEEQVKESEQEEATEHETAKEKELGPEEIEVTPVFVGVTSPEERVIDFATLQSKKNGHIYAWINVPGTNIDYPVLRHPTDNGYYLYHNLNGSSGYPGCIYTENYNGMDWTDPVTVLYGHDMRSTGTMFHQLHKFEKQNFFDTYQYIYIYTPEKTLKYRIFAAYVHTNEHLLGNHNFSNKEEFDAFFKMVRNGVGGVNHVRDDVEVTSDSKVITLSTCIKNMPDNRYLVFGVLEE